MRQYALLVASDQLAATALESLRHEAGLQSIQPSSEPVLPKGFTKGAAGGIAPLQVTSECLLSPAQLSSAVVNAALALVLHCDNENLGDADGTAAASAAAASLHAASTSWAAAVRLWREHTGCGGDSDSLSFRVATLRGGKHSCSSKQIDAAIGEAVLELQPSWTVDLRAPNVLVLCLTVQARLLVGLLLPPFAPRKSSVLPPEPRPWLTAGYDAGDEHRPHMRPSRAASLVRLLYSSRAAPCAVLSATGSVFLDPCGGIGILALEAARFANLLAISLDVDAQAAGMARRNANSAARAGVLRGSVLSMVGDAASPRGGGCSSGLRDGSVDGAIADLPYGMLYARMDVGRLVLELSRVMRVGGRALLVGSAGKGGTATACVKSARRYAPGCWRVEAEVSCAAGGVECTALLLERVAHGGIDAHGAAAKSSRSPPPSQPTSSQPAASQASEKAITSCGDVSDCNQGSASQHTAQGAGGAAAVSSRAAGGGSAASATPLSTASLEAESRCASCAAPMYLDAAANRLRCAACECDGAKVGSNGTAELAGGCFVDFSAQAIDTTRLATLAAARGEQQMAPAASQCIIGVSAGASAGSFFSRLMEEVVWKQHDDLLADGRVVSQPRRIAYQADDSRLVYAYEGITTPLSPVPFTPIVRDLKAQVESLIGATFNSAHFNLYTGGADHVSWHTDEDVDLYGAAPTIASVSFGAPRDFVLRRMQGEPYTATWKARQPPQHTRYTLGDADLLVMRGATQRHYEHAVLKAAAGGERINVTFRSARVPQ